MFDRIWYFKVENVKKETKVIHIVGDVRKKKLRAMFYFECCFVQRDFFSFDKMSYEMVSS